MKIMVTKKRSSKSSQRAGWSAKGSKSASCDVRIMLPIVFFSVIFLSCCSKESVRHNPGGMGQSSFGISNNFYGRLTENQESKISQAMHEAYCIEPVRNISRSELKKIAQKKEFIAEELNNGEHYVAMKDLRIVQFDTFAAGLMVYVERYRIVDN